MNIAFLLRLWPIYGGGETVTICLANEMVKRGHQVTVVYFKEKVKADLPFIDERIRTIQIPGVRCSEKGYSLLQAKYVRNEIEQIIEKFDIEFVINQWWPVCYVKSIRMNTKAKLIKCHHTAVYWWNPPEKWNMKDTMKRFFGPISRRMKRKLLKKVDNYLPYCDKFVFLSQGFMEQYKQIRNYKDPEHKLDFIYNPLTFCNFLPKEELANKEKEVLFVGRLIDTKKVDRILNAWKLIQDSEELNGWRLTILGDGLLKFKLKKMAEDLQLKHYSFDGYQAPLGYYKRASIFVLTSANEGWPMALMEAQMNGCVPIVMDSFLSVHDIIDQNVNGIIIPNMDVEEYSKQLLALIKDRDKREEMASSAIEGTKKYVVERIVDRWEQLLNTI